MHSIDSKVKNIAKQMRCMLYMYYYFFIAMQHLSKRINFAVGSNKKQRNKRILFL